MSRVVFDESGCGYKSTKNNIVIHETALLYDSLKNVLTTAYIIQSIVEPTKSSDEVEGTSLASDVENSDEETIKGTCVAMSCD